MALAAYRDVWGYPAVRQAIFVCTLGKSLWFATFVILTLHVVGPLGQSYAAAGVVTAVFTVGVAVSSPWRGRLLDTIGLRRTLLPSLVMMTLLFGAASFLPYVALAVGMGMAGLLAVPWFVLTRQMVIAAVPLARRRTAVALDSVASEIAFMVGPTIGVLVAVSWSTGGALSLFGLLHVVAAGLLWWRNPPLASAARDAPDATAPARGGVRTWLNGTVVATLAASLAVTFTLGGTDLAIVAGIRSMGSAALLPVALVAWSAGSLVGGLVYGALGDRTVPLMALVLALGATTLTPAFGSTPWEMSGFVALAGLFCAPCLAASTERIAHEVPESSRGEAMGWQGSSMTLGNAMAPPVVGWAIDAAGWQSGFLVTGALGLALAIVGALMLRLGRRTPSRVPGQSTSG